MNQPRKEQLTITSYFKSQEEYLNLLEAAIAGSEIGYMICDAECNVVKINQAQIRITGQEAAYNLGRNMRDIEIEDGSPSATVKVASEKVPVKLEQTLVNGNSYLVYSYPFFDQEGELKYIISNLLDTTEINKTKQELENNNRKLSEQLLELQNQIQAQGKIIYQSDVMRQTLKLCDKVAIFDSNILIQGESGVGKERIAEYIYEKSRRNTKEFIKLNCAAIPEALLESELFGYEAGAFTGASKEGKKGLLDFADKGTLMLDEIGELSLSLQAKLLRFLQEGEFYRVGGRNPVTADVRIIAATNRDLKEMVDQKTFRADLYYRLNVIPIIIPPLRERKEDIPLLIGHFTNVFNEKHEHEKTWTIEALNQMMLGNYPGNVRELQNSVERILVLIEKDKIEKNDVSAILYGIHEDSHVDQNRGNLKEMVQEYEKKLLSQYFQEYKTEEAVAQALQSSQSTISRKRIKYGIDTQ
ncbi:sigma-54 interaction domain-containing protein [Anaerotignum sp.]|uniref:sigma-54 interaction domain-containing protein n=1 Tax=Anaerotignum sp. TaxID=2039241 RepID=UPI002A7F0D38|nr:sigma 54-interacting transcriptional regulator [Anaerotignum sp.]MDY3595675.1 sigma 54-interacting transcriptional regulator [Anaerotignum sp.]